MTGSQMRQALRSGQRVYGTQIAGLANPLAAPMWAKMGMDFAFFCTEHVPTDRSEISLLCQLFAARGISPIVRVPSPDPVAISMAMDAGAQGITVPYVETPDEVRMICGAVRHRPLKGKLLRDMIADGTELPGETRRFVKEFNQHNYTIIGVESAPAIDNLDTLLAAGEVDAVFLGPHDITTSLGVPERYDDPGFRRAILDVVRVCRAAGVGVGLHMQLLKLGEDYLSQLLDAGMNWIINGADVPVLCDAMTTQLQQIRSLAGDEQGPEHSQDAAEINVQNCVA